MTPEINRLLALGQVTQSAFMEWISMPEGPSKDAAHRRYRRADLAEEGYDHETRNL